MRLDLKRLRTFVAVAEELGFARAGARLGLAQPAVSKHVKDLEHAVGGRLIERRAEGLRLTPAGALLLDEARGLLASASATEKRVRRLARGDAGSLIVAYNETVSWNSIIPRTIRRFREDNPEVALTLLPMLSIDQIEALQEHRIDAGFLFRWNEDASNIVSRAVLSTPIRVAVSEHSRWAGAPPQSLGDLADEPFILFPRRLAPDYYDALLARCAAAGFRPNVVQEVYNESASLSLVAVGMGITVVPESARDRCPAVVSLAPVPDLDLTVTLDLAWRADARMGALIARLVAAVDAVAASERLDPPAPDQPAASGA